MACDIGFTAGGLGRDPDVTRDCARKAGIEWEVLEACTKGPKVFDIMYSTAYANTVVTAMHRLQKAEFEQPPSMPWIFLDGQLLTCGGEGCVAVQTPFGRQALPEPGSLLALACARLDPQPEACKDIQQTMKPAEAKAESSRLAAERAKSCENCAEVGRFRWKHKARRWEQAPFHLLLGVLVVSLLGAAARSTSCGSRSWRSNQGEQAEPVHELHRQLGGASVGDAELGGAELATE